LKNYTLPLEDWSKGEGHVKKDGSLTLSTPSLWLTRFPFLLLPKLVLKSVILELAFALSPLMDYGSAFLSDCSSNGNFVSVGTASLLLIT
jgi:hypothetical protein